LLVVMSWWRCSLIRRQFHCCYLTYLIPVSMGSASGDSRRGGDSCDGLIGGGGGGGGEVALPTQISQCWSNTWLPCWDVVLASSGVKGTVESLRSARIPPSPDLESGRGFLGLGPDSCLGLELLSCLGLELESVTADSSTLLSSPVNSTV
jgi:hypothetical protein